MDLLRQRPHPVVSGGLADNPQVSQKCGHQAEEPKADANINLLDAAHPYFRPAIEACASIAATAALSAALAWASVPDM